MARIRMENAVSAELKSWDEVDETLHEIAEAEMEIEKITTDMNVKIHDLKQKADQKSKAAQEKIKTLEVQVKQFVEEHREDLKGKTMSLNHGQVGFRFSTKVITSKVEKIIEKLKKFGMNDCINVKETINKEVLRKYEEEDILKVGASLKKEDTFWYETTRDVIEDKKG